MREGFSEKAETIVSDVLDGLLPEGLKWAELVRTYPVPCLALAAVGGFLLGRSHGPAILGAVGSVAAAEVAKNVSSLLGQELES
jgi:hypothetical protein